MSLRVLKKRVLVIDDEPVYGESIAEELRKHNCEVVWVDKLADARLAIQNGGFHFAVIDLHLDEIDPQYPGGVELVALLEKEWPAGSKDAFVVITTDDPNNDPKVKALCKERLLPKTTIDQCIAEITNLSNDPNLTGYNWKLIIQPGDALPDDINLKFDADVLIGDSLKAPIEDVLRQLFIHSDTISLLSLGVKGFSNTYLFKAARPSDKGKPRSYVIKIGDKLAVKQEGLSVKQFVEPFSMDCAPRLDGPVYARCKKLGALQFYLVGDAKTLTQLIRDADSDIKIGDCCRYIERMFSDLEECWYSSARIARLDVPSDLFPEDKMSNIVDTFARCFAELDTDKMHYTWERDEKIYRAQNPLKRIPLKTLKACNVPRCIVHGDLHSGNVMIKNGSQNLVVIDFAETADGQLAYLDFAKFESHVVMDILNSHLSGFEFKDRVSLIQGLYANSDNFWNCENANEAAKKISRKFEYAISIISTIRRQLNGLIRRFYYEPNDGEFEKLPYVQHYCATLLRFYVMSWTWMHKKDQFNDVDRKINLLVCSKLLDMINSTSETEIIKKQPIQ